MWGLHNHYSNGRQRASLSRLGQGQGQGHFNGSTLDLMTITTNSTTTTTARRKEASEQGSSRGGPPLFHPHYPAGHDFRTASPSEDDYEWQTDYSRRLNALRINTQVPNPRFQPQRAQTFPEHFQTGTSRIASPPAPPPRNPRRHFPRDLNWRPASSVYEEDFLDIDIVTTTSFDPSKQTVPRTMAEISPPSSPEGESPVNLAGNVSPIEDEPPVSRQDLGRDRTPKIKPSPLQYRKPGQETSDHSTSKKGPQNPLGRSAIPVMRKTTSQISLPHSNEPSPLMLQNQYIKAWDSPEQPSTHQSRFPPHLDPNLPFGLNTTVTGPRTNRTASTGSPSFGERLKHLGRDSGRAIALDERPPWSGASGREAQVRPVRDEYNAKPLQVRPKDRRVSEQNPNAAQNSRGQQLLKGGSRASHAVQSLFHGRSKPKTGQPSPISSPEPVKSTSPVQQAYPSPSYTDSPAARTHSPDTPLNTFPSNSESPEPIPEPIPETTAKPIKRKPAPTVHSKAVPSVSEQHFPLALGNPENTTSQDGGAYPTLPITKSDEVGDGGDDDWIAPLSRFSVTTYATSKAESPRASLDEDRPPLPTAPEKFRSVMDRTRPVMRESEGPDTSSSQPIKISMTSSYSPAAALSAEDKTKKKDERERELHLRTISVEDNSSHRRGSVTSTTKALPPAPPEILSANDRVANLSARLDGLAHRRDNINRSIRQMTELMPQHRLMAGTEVLQRREEEKEKVERLREELADIQREEYDLGIKLHLANKRLARDSEFESTNLWVRRVRS